MPKDKNYAYRKGEKESVHTNRGTPQEQVIKYQYLGHMLTEDVPMRREIDIRTEKARAKFWKLKELLRGNINIDTKKRILQCYVFLVCNYGCKTWTFTKAFKDKIKSFEMWCNGRVLRISWKEHMVNEEVLQAADVTGRQLDQLINRKLHYAGHVIIGSSGHLLQLALESKLRAEEVEDALKGAGLTTSSNGPTDCGVVITRSSNKKSPVRTLSVQVDVKSLGNARYSHFLHPVQGRATCCMEKSSQYVSLKSDLNNAPL
ncbi:endonuclease-reverse transcriptase [Elysia marginata]|uniref:Endonuclease-reverse transcriptase n=1 Tax=Elysia marginata TaxID=1093978 RepID=A0AAV4EK00_9GAST|nr:endonuclease-reverse transcriptase [Elysia marginata]